MAGFFSASTVSASQTGSFNKILLLSSSENESVIKFILEEYGYNPVTTPWGEASVTRAKNTTPILKKGAPDLPKFTASVIVPDLAKMGVKVVSSSYTDYPAMEIAPSKGNITRDIDPQSVSYEKGIEYAADAFFPGLLTELRDPYILRDYRGQTVIVYPFHYNPVTHTLRVYSEIIVKIFQSGNNGVNTIARAAYPEAINSEFATIYKKQFLNAAVTPLYAAVGEFGKMLIIYHGAYLSAMQPFVDWKKRTGIQVTMVDVAAVGANATAIKNYVQNFYDTQGLTFLLLVGDAAQVPPMVLPSGDSDNGYAYVAGSDNYPDILAGRFSAENTAQVTTQVDRIIRYEKFPQANGTWYNKGVGIASNQGPGDDNEYDWEHVRNIRTQLMSFTYTSIEELYDGSQSGADASGAPASTLLTDALNSGVSIINYTGHGSQNSWVTTGFNTSDVEALTNTNKYPFVWSVGCVNGDFDGPTCFAETWLRATDSNGEPAGALAMMASTINQYWDEPMEAQDEFNAILTETYLNNIKRTFGGISMNGCMQMNDAYGSSGEDMTDTWVLFGDPSVMVRTATPLPMAVTHIPQEVVGVTQLVVSCNTEGALIGLTLNGNVLGSGIVNGGTATITFPAITLACIIDITITAFNKMPYLGTVSVLNALGVDPSTEIISAMDLYPNPAVSYSMLSYTVTSSEQVTITLYDAVGREVANILNDKAITPGTYSVKVDAVPLMQGIYFCTVRTGESALTKKLVVMK